MPSGLTRRAFTGGFAGATWPGSDAALLVLVPAIAVYALSLVAVLRKVQQRRAVASVPALAEVS